MKTLALLPVIMLTACGTTIETQAVSPQTGAVVQRTYKVAYGNTIRDELTRLTVEPNAEIVQAGERVVIFGMQYGGQTLWNNLAHTAVNKAMD